MEDVPERPPRVLVIIGSLDIGGSERQVVRFVTAAHPEHAHCTVVCLGEAGAQAPVARAAGVEVVPLRLKGVRPLGVLRLARVIRRTRPDVVYGLLFWGYTLAMPLAAATRPAALRVAGRRSLPDADVPGRRWALGLRRVADRFTHAVIANSEAVADAWTARYPRLGGRMFVVPNGTPLPQARDPHDDAGTLTIACVANLIAYKGHAHLLDAVAALPESSPAWRLVLAGDGPERARLEQKAQDLGLDGRVRFLGLVPDIGPLLEEAAVAVLPSLTEGLPNAVLEAMAASLPVVGTSVGGVPELLAGGAGLVVPPGDSAALRDALAMMLADAALRRTAGAAGRAVIEAGYSTDAMRDATLAVFARADGLRRVRDRC